MSKTTVRCLVASVVLDLFRRARLTVIKARAVNVAILLLLTLELASGLGSFLVGGPGRPVGVLAASRRRPRPGCAPGVEGGHIEAVSPSP